MTNLRELAEQQEEVDFEIYAYSVKKLQPFYEKRADFVRGIEGFWPKVIENSELLGDFITYEDSEALEALVDLRIHWDSNNVRNFTISMEFKENPYFEASTLAKIFEYNRELEHCTSVPVTINWRPGKRLTTDNKQGPETSFFNWFAYEGSTKDDHEGADIAQIFATELYPHAIKFYEADPDDVESEYDLEIDDDEENSDNGNLKDPEISNRSSDNVTSEGSRIKRTKLN